MTDLISRVSPGVKALRPYQPGKPIEELQREYGIGQVVKLASNENPLGPSPLVTQALSALVNGDPVELARYPDGNGFILKKALQQNLHQQGVDVTQEQITLGNGSNDVLELIARAFVAEGDEVVFSQHAFAVYPLVSQAVNATAVVTPARLWGHDLEAMAAAVSAKTKVVFIANPNNPTGTWLGEQALQSFLEAVPPDVIVVIDEAYFEYASDSGLGAKGYPNTMLWLSRYPNLVVTRTFSKAYGLASVRVGYSVSHAQVSDALNRVRQPFNVNTMALVAATRALSDQEHVTHAVALNARGMAQLTEAFDRLSLEYIPSVGNFVCVKVGDSGTVYESLLRKGVIVRPVANYQMPEYLRITVGTVQENEVFIKALAQVLAS